MATKQQLKEEATRILQDHVNEKTSQLLLLQSEKSQQEKQFFDQLEKKLKEKSTGQENAKDNGARRRRSGLANITQLQEMAKLHQNQPYDESLEVPDSEEVASNYTPSPRAPIGGGRSRGNTPPDSRMDDEFDEEFEPQAPPAQQAPLQAKPPKQPA
ncbi:unnamed protein product, partial [Owenia fusiformis]